MSNEDFNIELNEIEFKYDAENIKLSDFLQFAESLTPKEKVQIGSWDFYYSGKGMLFEFIRFRNGSEPELTIKIKNDEKNNQNRFEIDLPLSKKVSEFLVRKFVELLGFKENFRIFKYCEIFWYEKVDLVYYTIYNKDMKEVGRRIEIEALKNYPFKSPEEAFQEIKTMEQKLSEIGITPQMRLKKSMWETFKT